MLMLYLDINHR